jgi:hypothetical protein
MNFYPENVLLEIISLLNASAPPGGSLTGQEAADLSLQDLHFVWWLECFLRTEPAVFQEEFDSLSQLEQSHLAAQTWRCFLYQPTMRRLFPWQSRPEKTHPWKVVRDGSLLQLTSENEREATTGLYYIFPHRRLWPGLADTLRGRVSLAPEDLISIQTAIEFTLRSRLAEIRNRAEGLRSSLFHPDLPSPREEKSLPAEPDPKIEVFKPKSARKRKKSREHLNLFE